MRLDKFLKVSRIIKRRTVAKEFIDKGKVLLNGKIAKASSEVNIGQIITLNNADYVVKNVFEFATEEKAKEMYEIIAKK